MESYTWNEINSQAEKLEQTAAAVENQSFKNHHAGTVTLFTGCGTSFYLACSAAKYYQKITGKPAAAVPASELILCPDEALAADTSYQIVFISRSGTTSEAVLAAKKTGNRENTATLAVTCSADSPLAEYCDESIVLSFVNEKSVVMTQSFSAMLYAIQLYTAKIAGNQEALRSLLSVPEQTKSVLSMSDVCKDMSVSKKWSKAVFLGSGVYNGLAKEAALKLKEMTQTACESYCSLEFRHGPISITDSETAIILIGSASTKEYDLPLLRDCKQHGAAVYYIGPELTEAEAGLLTAVFEIPGEDQIVSAMPYLQKMAYYRAVSLGLDPDHPKHLSQVVQISIS